jgi:hypothetical protein
VKEIRLETLGDLGSNHTIYAICDACNRSTRVERGSARGCVRSSLRIDELKRRLACSKCGKPTREIRIVSTVAAR